MNYNSGNARRNFYAKWDKLREEYRAAGMKEDAIQKMYEYDLAVFNDDRAHHRYDVEIPSADDSENRNDYADFVRATTVTDTYHETKTRFAWVGEVQNERLQVGLEKLSDDDLKLLTLYVYEGYSTVELSKAYGIAHQNISKRIIKITNFLKNFDFIVCATILAIVNARQFRGIGVRDFFFGGCFRFSFANADGYKFQRGFQSISKLTQNINARDRLVVLNAENCVFADAAFFRQFL